VTMRYAHPHRAFLFEAVTGFITFVLVFTAGTAGLAALAFIAFRPFLLQTTSVPPDQAVYRLHYGALRTSAFFTAVLVLLTVVAFQFNPSSSYDKALVLTLIVPWFVLTHGFIGYVLSKPA